MKKMTCKQLGGACDHVFEANTFEEIAKISQAHGKEMFQKEDQAHLVAMNEMMELMKRPGAMAEWMQKKEAEFNALPEE